MGILIIYPYPSPATQKQPLFGVVYCNKHNRYSYSAHLHFHSLYMSGMDFQAPDWAGEINADRRRIWKYDLLYCGLTK